MAGKAALVSVCLLCNCVCFSYEPFSFVYDILYSNSHFHRILSWCDRFWLANDDRD